MTGTWLTDADRAAPAAARLLCLPYAGGGASAYRGWQAAAPRGLRVCPLEPPGRGRRLLEAPFTRLAPLVRSLTEDLAGVLDRPYALFGHSMGALIAFELARALRQRGLPPPVRLFVSGSAAPEVPRHRPGLRHATGAQIREELRSLGGTPPELLANDELMDLVLPALRADFSLLETYEYRVRPPLPVPITVFGGRSDPSVRLPQLYPWRGHGAAGTRLLMLPGDHFFLHTATAAVWREIRTDLAHDLPAGLPGAGAAVKLAAATTDSQEEGQT
ncbi:alpha/beta fold hydrolase [Streptomyces sp. B1866]|uniref:thioesterase II family protein n=1 Tax=Streptomyces sp. B1866 TaxID=3075431 RepID=UPI0028914D05|nr:alpha/beta fold hydrolase [Streptomyces sp. B1866]MDT3395983.1 alpha/beta fold hydrolase [Streptomyces sp. B1866]